METRRLISAVLITMAAVILFQAGHQWLGRKLGWDMTRTPPPPETSVETPTTGPATTPATAEAGQPTITAAAAPTAALQVARAPATQPAARIQLGSPTRKDPTFRMAIQLSTQGAGIEQVVLNEFTRAVESDDPYVFQRPLPTNEPASRSLATQSIVVDGNSLSLAEATWTLDVSDPASATFSTVVNDSSGPVVRLVKTFQMLTADDPSRGYEIVVTQSVQNVSGTPRTVRLTTNGTVTPPPEVDRGPDRNIIAGYDYDLDSAGFQGEILHHAIETFAADKPAIDVTKYEDFPAQWAGALSVYFNAIARPVPPAQADWVAASIAKVEAIAFNPAAEPHERHAGIQYQTGEMQLAPNQTGALAMRVFFGPRQRTLLKEDYYASIGYNQTLVLTSGPCGVCTFQWLIDLLVLLLRLFYMFFRDWGVAIICLVVLVRAILHPITKRSQISMMKMAKLGPEMERLRKKHGDNKDELNKAMLEFHKQQGVGPYLGCLPMFLQMPIWIALWSALYSTFELRHASFLWGFTWIKDLAKPDHLIEFQRPFNIFFLHVSGINLLPILMGVVFYVQMKLQPKPAVMTKEQQQQQKIMQWMMPLLFPLMLYNGPSGLNLYILTSTFIGIIESKIIRDHIKQREEAEAQERVIVDAKPTRGSRKSKKFDPPEHQRKAGIGGWLSRLQEWADQQRREQDRRGKGP